MSVHPDDRASKLKGLIWVAVACLAGAAFAFGLSPLAHAIPWSWEQALGETLDMDMPGPECRYSLRAHSLLQQLVKRIYPIEQGDGEFSIDVQVANSPVVNAYAMLGGRIFINAGLLKQAESPEEVAGVLAHEITHVKRRHIMEGALTHMLTSQGITAIFGANTSSAEWADYFLRMDFTRAQEAQADEGALKRLQQAHVDNSGFRHFFERMEASGSGSQFLSDHPSNEARIAMADTFPNKDTKPVMTPEEWAVVKNYCGTQ